MLNRINEKIKSPKVRVILENKNLGIIDLRDALSLAKSKNLDLIEISSNPPVCKIADYGKVKYLESKKVKQKPKIKEKEIKINVHIDPHDLETKINHIKDFIKSSYKTKVIILFKGREIEHTDIGFDLSNNIIDSIREFNKNVKITNPRIEGKQITFYVS